MAALIVAPWLITELVLIRRNGGVALDSSGNLYFSESAGNRIRKLSNGVLTTIAGTGAAGFSGEQLFFLSFAQSWRTKTREPAARQRLVTDSHAPPEYRADTVRNLDAWYQAFDVKPGEKLYLAPAQRVPVW